MALLLQVAIIGFAILQILLMIFALRHLRKQALSNWDLLFWDAIVVFVPFGFVLVFMRFPYRR